MNGNSYGNGMGGTVTLEHAVARPGSTPFTEHPSLTGAPWDEVTVGEVVQPGVIVCSPESPARNAAWLMATHRIHAVVTLGDDEDGGVWGVVTDTDVLAAAAAGDLDRLTAGAIGKTPLATVSWSDSLLHALDVMRGHRMNHLLVTRGGRPVGVVSTLDLVRAAAAGVGVRPRS